MTMIPGPIRVLLVDDDDLMRAGLRAIISSDPTIEVVGEAATGRGAVGAVRALGAELVPMAVRLPDWTGSPPPPRSWRPRRR